MFLGIYRGTCSSEYSEEYFRRYIPIDRCIYVQNASIDECPRKYPDDVLPRYILRTFPTNEWSSEFPRKFVSSEFRRKIPRDFRGKKKFRGIISDDLFRRYVVGITVFRRNSDDFFPQNPCCFLVVERAEGLVNNYKVPESGLTDVLLMQSHAIGGIDTCRASYLN
ncbi:hypothetical protein DY000_02052944 [Brassica cretica]|uniref:Uncharacterized protein n=1 Tax=Brassica cretica TaxID=69181 RepID=A0ABQ7AFN9_BRACR|nr:hypothetical protein DY000_02052944 [Brassica cretica]